MISSLPRVQRLCADIFEFPIDQITPSTSPETLEAWDSLRHLISSWR